MRWGVAQSFTLLLSDTTTALDGASLFPDRALLQHNIMARPRFKRWVTSYVPDSAERALFAGTAAAMAQAIIWLWRPMTQVVWRFPNSMRWLPLTVFWGGLALEQVAEAFMDPLELAGLTQAFGRVETSGEMALSPLHGLVSDAAPRPC